MVAADAEEEGEVEVEVEEVVVKHRRKGDL